METIIVIITIIVMSLIYLFIGFGINKDNAKYLLAGYNTMPSKKKTQFRYRELFKIF